jgi:hypothetical protein
MVSPVYKGGYGINDIVAVSPGGDRVVFVSAGAFSGDTANNPLTNDYAAVRFVDTDAAGWSIRPLLPPTNVTPRAGLADLTPELDTTLIQASLGPNNGYALYQDAEQEFLTQSIGNAGMEAGFEVSGGLLQDLDKAPFKISYEGSSADFSQIAVLNEEIGSQQLLSEAAKGESDLYDIAPSQACGSLGAGVCMALSSSGASVGSIRLIGLDNEGKVISPACRPSLGGLNSFSASGKEISFALGVDSACTVPQLFMRVGGERTLEISKPLAEKCTKIPCSGAKERAPAAFVGMSEDGSKVFFTASLADSQSPLVPGDVDVSMNLYMASIGCPGGASSCGPSEREVTGLLELSHDSHGEATTVDGVIAVAPDGSHAYFVAQGDLLTPAEIGAREAEGRKVPHVGAANLYEYDSVTEKVQFVTDLCTGSSRSGTVEDIGCPQSLGNGESNNDSQLWNAGEREAQVNVCARPSMGECIDAHETGRFLLFASYGRLTNDDTDDGKDVYRYDSVTGILRRVSIGEVGRDANGNGLTSSGQPFTADIALSSSLRSAIGYAQRSADSRAISEDGSRIVFTTDEPLSEAGQNGVADAYEWDEGHVSLVSSGSATQAVDRVLLSSSGDDVFFDTSQSLVPEDTDGQKDVYDARLGYMPPIPTYETEACAGDACQGPLTNPAPLLVPGSVSQVSGETVSASSKAKVRQKRTKKRRKTRARHRRSATRRVRRSLADSAKGHAR